MSPDTPYVLKDVHEECMGNTEDRILDLNKRIACLEKQVQDLLAAQARTQGVVEGLTKAAQNNAEQIATYNGTVYSMIQWMQGMMAKDQAVDDKNFSVLLKYGGWIIAGFIFVFTGLKFGGVI